MMHKNHLFLLSSCILLAGITSILVGQDLNYDFLQYHFYNGYAFFHHRLTKDLGPAMIQTYINPFFDIINYSLVRIQYPRVIEFLLGIFTGIGAFILYQICFMLFANYPTNQKRIFAFFSILIGMSGAGALSLINTTTNDTKVALLTFISLYLLLKAINTTRSSTALSYISSAALISGLMTGFKLTAACYTVGLFGTFFLFGKLDRPHRKQCFLFLLMAGVGFLLANGYWMFILNKHFANPFFPYFNNIFHSSYAPFVSFNLPPTEAILHFHHYLFFFFYVAIKADLASEMPLRDPRLLTLFALSIIVGLKLIYNKYQLKITPSTAFINQQIENTKYFLFMFFIISYLTWLSCFAVYRYMLPLEWLTGICIVYAISQLFTSSKSQYICLSILTIILIANTQYPNWHNRNAYHGNFLSVSVPPVPENALVLITTAPLAYVAPFFPEATQFIGMPFVNLGVETVTAEQINKRKILSMTMQRLTHEIQSRPIYTLSFERDDSFTIKTLKILNFFGMQQLNNCQVIKTNIIGKHEKLKLCKVATKGKP